MDRVFCALRRGSTTEGEGQDEIMACTIDHLRRDLRVRVLQAFQDKGGIRHEAGVMGTIRTLEYDPVRAEFQIAWEVAGKVERLTFDLRSQTGPGNGRMKQFFEDLGDELPTPGTRVRFSRAPRSVRPPPLLPGFIRRGPGRDEHVLQRAWALAAARQFKEAEEQLRELDQSWNRACAEALTTAVEVHADDEEGTVYEWLREQATDLWYCWGSTATSGGEGAAMMPYIRAATDRFGEIDRHRALHLPGKGGREQRPA